MAQTTTAKEAPAMPTILHPFQFTRERGPVLTAEHDGLIISVWIVRHGNAKRLPTWAWSIMAAPVAGEPTQDCPVIRAGYGEGAAIACAEALNALNEWDRNFGGQGFDSFRIVGDPR